MYCNTKLSLINGESVAGAGSWWSYITREAHVNFHISHERKRDRRTYLNDDMYALYVRCYVPGEETPRVNATPLSLSAGVSSSMYECTNA